MSPAAREPLKVARVVTLTLAWIFAVIASCVGLNALIKSNQQKSKLKKLAPSPTVVFIDTSDIFNVGVLATTVNLILAIIVSKSLIGMFLPISKAFVRRTLRIQSYIILLFCALLFGTMIPYMIYFTSHHAKVTAFIGTTQLPDSVIKSVEASSGSTSVYKKIDYLKLVAIFPWISLFFNLIAATVLYKAGGVTVAPTEVKEVQPSSPSMTEKEDSPKYIEDKESAEV
ncbi:hypothetical protein BDN70DRAFT_875880 [Pholiota conissans]|uniref:Uncharacterized protein n=1 Tax=Pholiota conissans TaxID=109636 RepID=A0A9P6D2T2_9AGAR|nr:hypothetical protein BDN70DRAFT_875880 [Pholiota conissans]